MSRLSRDVPWESAVVVRVPALDQTIDALRRRFHLPLKPNGIQPHITVVIPFLPAAELGDDGALPALRVICSQFESFDVSFSRTARFRRVLYLVPEPAEPFIALARVLTAGWPQVGPYAGGRKELVPHLTVTTSRPPKVFDKVAEALRPELPVRAQIDEVQVYLFDRRRWTEHVSLGLRPAPDRPSTGG
jgi:2'-5' RNA ligase